MVFAFCILLAGAVSFAVSGYFSFVEGGSIWMPVLQMLVVAFIATTGLGLFKTETNSELSWGDWFRQIFVPLPAGFRWKISTIWIVGFWAFGVHSLYRFLLQADRLSSDPGLFWMSVGAGLSICGGSMIAPTVFLNSPPRENQE